MAKYIKLPPQGRKPNVLAAIDYSKTYLVKDDRTADKKWGKILAKPTFNENSLRGRGNDL